MSVEVQIVQLIEGNTSIPSETLAGLLTDPNNGEVLHPQRASSAEAVEAAIATAHTTHSSGIWSGLDRAERAAALRRLCEQMKLRTGEFVLADSLDTGVPLATTTMLADATIEMFDTAALQLEAGYGHTELSGLRGPADQWHLPWGPAAVFLPWNAPTTMAMWKVSAALLGGCPVILKPSEWAPHFAAPFAEAIQAADVPAGAVQILQGGPEVGAAIAGDARIAALSYTGGLAGGRAVAVACAQQLKPVELELSGNDPVVVLPEANPEVCAARIVGGPTDGGMVFLNGQWCVAPRRVFVPAELYDELATALFKLLDELVIGPTDDSRTELGPIAYPDHLNRLEKQLAGLAESGASVQRFGSLPDLPGHFMQPAVVTGASEDGPEEIFGPVLSLAPYHDLDEAVARANDHPYGLGAYVLGNDQKAARAVGKRLRAGIVKINNIEFGPAAVGGVAGTWGSSGLGEIGPDTAGPFVGARIVG